MDILFTGGKLGEMFTSLAFASALVAMVSFFFAEKAEGTEKGSWERMGVGGFSLHVISILGIIATIFYLIYTKQYQYHYVWDHASNELPVHYIISCFWEGQEGSFLLWCFWHCVLGMILLFNKTEWRNLVLAVLASIELILSSMILGIYVGDSWVGGIYLALGLVPFIYFVYQFSKNRNSLIYRGNFHLASIFVAMSSVLLVVQGQMGFYPDWSFASLSSFDGFVFGLFLLVLIGYTVFYIFYISAGSKQTQYPLADIIGGLSIILLAGSALAFEPDVWKVGSSPFVLLKSVFANNPIYETQPDFVPSNGSGLNPLLQNYWMVIHPPTLFLGFASTAVPFAFVVAGLIKGKYKEWIRPAMPWASFSVMILGVGIIMGGYWAYETLNFGGYWNWDPVENSSFVPWLCGVASLHAMLIYQRSKAYLRLTMIMIMSTFLLVLYSTFLTRSGILGETSVHTFTDLGLSGQLLVLVFLYLIGVSILMALRWKDIPQRDDESKVWSAEFMLFLGVLVFVFAGLEIVFTTSLPVVNKIFGTNVAPPPNVQLFYYQWNVWFSIGFGILSGIGQFLWWRMGKKSSVSDALFRPFIIAIVAACVIVVGITLADMKFAYDSEFAKIIDPLNTGSGFLAKGIAYIKYGIISMADEILLFSSLFAVIANLDILIAILRKNRKGMKVMGGTIVHIGFGFMLLGMLFSSGYDEVISKNLRPAELGGFPEDEKVDNVLLPKDLTRMIPGYEVTYTGRKEAKPPVSDLFIIEENSDAFKLKFKDASGDWFGTVMPRDVFVKENAENASEHSISPTADGIPNSKKAEGEVDLGAVKEFLDEKVELLKPGLLNNRTKYKVAFKSLDSPRDTFNMELDVEINEQMGSTITHPSRRIYWNRDVYVFASYVSNAEEIEPEYENHQYEMRMGDTVRLGNTLLYLESIKQLSENEELKDFDIAAAAHIYAYSDQGEFFANPIYLIKDRQPGMIPAEIKELHLELAFVSVDPNTGTLLIQARKQTNPYADQIVIKAIKKPWINLLWLGTFILTFGFVISIYRRIQESKSLKAV